MKIISWNVNGLRARLKAGFIESIKELEPDILCLQEVRATAPQLTKEAIEFFNKTFSNYFINAHDRLGYAGVMTLSKEPVERLTQVGENGRILATEYDDFIVINVYSPNAGRDLERLEHRLEWERELSKYLYTLEKPFIICGDMNVAPARGDCNVYSKAGTTKEERAAFEDIKFNHGLVDVYRLKHPLKQAFTWFSHGDTGKGMRIDHFLTGNALLSKVKSIEILEDKTCGSDHAPVEIVLR